MGEGAGLEGVYFVSVPTMPVPLIKARGQQCRVIENKKYCLAATTECGEWPGQALQDVSILQATGGGGGGRVGSVLVTINIPVEINLYSVLPGLFLRFGWRFDNEALELVSWRYFRISAKRRTQQRRAKHCRYCPIAEHLAQARTGRAKNKGREQRTKS
jgi:hypothetical protein